jgi:DNA-binding NtrC family response regulator
LVDSLLEAELFGTKIARHRRPGPAREVRAGGPWDALLDEVGICRHAQAALLRALQSLTIERVGGHRSRHVDTRLVVATNRPLSRLVARRQFRADLFYRLSALEIAIPPLLERPADIRPLAEYFLAQHGTARVTLSRQALDTLAAYAWPGNVRELERVIQCALAWTDGPEVQVEALPAHIQRPREDVRVDRSLRAWTARHVVAVLRQCGGNKRLACLRLGISYHTLQAHLGKWHARQHRRAA